MATTAGGQQPRNEPEGEDVLAGLDLDRPSPARMYDYYLGGAHNTAADREAADRVLAMLPETATFARDNRSFLARVVRHLCRAGITQFLDLGSGIPTVGNVHEIARSHTPDARVVYVDHEQIAVNTAHELLAGDPNTAMVQADVREPATVLQHPDVVRLLDFTRPVAVLLVSVFPFVADADDPAGIVAAYREACPPGSYLALSHSLTPEYWPGAVADAIKLYDGSTHPLHLRTPEQVGALFSGYQLVDPGLVFTSAWRPEMPVTDEQARASRGVAALGKLPG